MSTASVNRGDKEVSNLIKEHARRSPRIPKFSQEGRQYRLILAKNRQKRERKKDKTKITGTPPSDTPVHDPETFPGQEIPLDKDIPLYNLIPRPILNTLETNSDEENDTDTDCDSQPDEPLGSAHESTDNISLDSDSTFDDSSEDEDTPLDHLELVRHNKNITESRDRLYMRKDNYLLYFDEQGKPYGRETLAVAK